MEKGGEKGAVLQADNGHSAEYRDADLPEFKTFVWKYACSISLILKAV